MIDAPVAPPDARVLDAPVPDARVADAPIPDARIADARVADARPVDAPPPDAMSTDAGAISAAPCLIGGSVLYLDGDPGDLVHPGAETISGPGWTFAQPPSFTGVYIFVRSLSPSRFWSLNFASAGDANDVHPPLTVGRYDDAQRWPFAAPGHPELAVFGDGRGCNTLNGRFEVLEIQQTGSTVTRFTATFEQHCQELPPALRGCVHYER